MLEALQAFDKIVSNLRYDLYRQLKDRPSYRFLSISLEIETVDPLAVLQGIIPTHQPFFYLENWQQQVVALGFDIARIRIGKGDRRFAQAREFIQDCLANTLTAGAIHHPLSGPHFFCNFTFVSNGTPQLWHDTVFPDATILFPRWQVMRSPHHCLLVANLEIEPSQRPISEQIETIVRQVRQGVQQVEQLSDRPVTVSMPFPGGLQGNCAIPLDAYKSGVGRAVEAISTGQLKKIVLANAMDVKVPRPFQIAASLQVLRQTYPRCYVFAVRHAGGATFLGASPEILLRTSDRQLIAEAMAGSAPRGQTRVADAELANGLLQNRKELHEHQVVVAFIVDCLRQLGLAPQFPKALSLRQLSNIQHLWTPIQASLPDGIHPLDVLARLHPTPAMAGIPRDRVLARLRDYEPFDRLLYAAPLGWVNARGDSEFVVGIRSALIRGDRARLYAGAGIVAGSDPNRELAEVQLKLRALLNTLV